jgi:hypothetical protein
MEFTGYISQPTSWNLQRQAHLIMLALDQYLIYTNRRLLCPGMQTSLVRPAAKYHHGRSDYLTRVQPGAKYSPFQITESSIIHTLKKSRDSADLDEESSWPICGMVRLQSSIRDKISQL